MELNRREFLKFGGAGMGAVVLFKGLGTVGKPGTTVGAIPLRKRIGEKTTICPYDASGCGFVVGTEGGKVVNIEGDPDHPVNRGAGCSKGASMRQLAADNPRRLTHVLYRAPGGTDWQRKSWDWAIDEISRRIKDTRDASLIERDSGGRIVNRTEALASLGSAALDNEECYLLVKLARALGLVYIEHHARI
jgi:formate dehydrogenase major subunit